MGRFGTETLALPENRAALADLNGTWIDRFHDRNGLKYIVLDVDSSVSPTHRDQEGAAWNGHFGCTCYHPNFMFNQFGMLERCALRDGNVHSADGWRDVLDPVIARYARRNLGGRFFRADAAYAIPALYERLEETGYFYAIRLRANNVLREQIAHRLTRLAGASVTDKGHELLRGLPVSGCVPGQGAPRHRQDRGASGRAVPPRGLHCRQPAHGAR